MRSRLAVSITALVLISLACGQVAPKPGPDSTPEPILAPDGLWLRMAGDSKSDQSWAVVTDDRGNLYWGTQQQDPGELYTDMVIYKYAMDGALLWERRWGGQFQEKCFILAVSPPYLLVGGEQDLSMNISQADMVVLALDLQDGSVEWEFSFDQGFGYEEVDGLVADGDYIYVSGWTTGETTGNDVGVLKLDRDGHQVWFSSWSSDKWDQADGQMVVDDQYIYVTGRAYGENILLGGFGLLVKFRKDTGEYVRDLVWNDQQFYDGYGMTSDGEYLYVTGITLAPAAGTLGNGQIFTQKWDKDLNLIWERQWGGAGGDQARAIGVDDAGHTVVAGNATIAGDKQIVLLVYDRAGELVSETVWGGAGEDVVHGLWLDGEYAYLAGQVTPAGERMSDALLIKAHVPSATFPALP